MDDTVVFIEDYLAHVYDPVKAHEYYERTKKLKGRKRNAGRDGSVRAPSTEGRQAAPPPGRPKPKPAATSTLQARIAATEARLATLKDVLSQLVEAAKKRSGVDTETPAEKKAASNTPDKPKTRQQKKEDAKRAKEAREKAQPPSQELRALQAEVRSVMAKIADARADLEAAAKRSPKNAGPKPATKKPEKKPSAVEGRHH